MWWGTTAEQCHWLSRMTSAIGFAVGSSADGLIYPAAAPGVTVARAGIGGGDAAGESGGG